MQDHTTNQISIGFCQCGCGQKTRIADKTDRGRNHVKGQPLRFINNHNTRAGEWIAPEVCACGCGQPIKKASGPSQQHRFISGHNNRQPVEKRFWERVDKRGPDECWPWTAGTGNHGYGTLSVNGSPKLVHRIAWELANGPIPEGLHVLHKCDNRPCCNVAHHFLGTNLDNIQDMVSKGRQAKGPDKKSYKGEANATAVLTDPQVIDIRERCARGEKQSEIAKTYGVSKGHISHIFNRDVWKHI